MDKKQYTHPTPKHHDHDYSHDMRTVSEHIKNIICDGYHKGHLQHLGGAASLHDHLEDMHYGEACDIKKVLGNAVEYLFFYHETCHNIYCFFAEDKIMLAEQMLAEIHDPSEKEHAMYFLNCVEEYKNWLKAKKYSKEEHHDGRMPSISASVSGGSTVNL